jgi:hypothetical protein
VSLFAQKPTKKTTALGKGTAKTQGREGGQKNQKAEKRRAEKFEKPWKQGRLPVFAASLFFFRLGSRGWKAPPTAEVGFVRFVVFCENLLLLFTEGNEENKVYALKSV